MGTIEVNGDRLYSSCSRPDSAKSLVLIHGSGADHTTWPRRLRQSGQTGVYALDLPGHGQSGGQGRDRVEEYAQVVESFVTGLGLNNVYLAGHSLGGAIVQTLGLSRPGWLSGLILVGTGCRLRVAQAILEGLLSDFEQTVDLVCEWAYGPEASAELVRSGRKVFLQADPLVMHNDFKACDRFDLTERVSEIELPTLIVSGSEDKLTPVKYGRFLRDRISGSRLIEIPGSGHMLALEKPEEFTGAVLKFIED